MPSDSKKANFCVLCENTPKVCFRLKKPEPMTFPLRPAYFTQPASSPGRDIQPLIRSPAALGQLVFFIYFFFSRLNTSSIPSPSGASCLPRRVMPLRRAAAMPGWSVSGTRAQTSSTPGWEKA